MNPKNIPSVKNINGASFNADKSQRARFCGGKILVCITVRDTVSVPSMMKANTLVAHANPIRGCK